MTYYNPALELWITLDGLVEIQARLSDALQVGDLCLDAQAEVNTAIAEVNAASEAIRRALGAVG